MTTRLSTTLRAERAARRLSQEKLASLAGVSRQAYAAIEAGRSGPSAEVALRLARALGTTVEALFSLAGEREIEAELVGGRGRGTMRVRVAHLAGRAHAYPLRGGSGHAWERADGIAKPLAGGRARVELVDDRPAPPDLVVMGCDPSFALVAETLRRRRSIETLWVHGGSRAGLEALARGAAHVAGIHLYDSGTGEYNEPWIRRLVPFPCTRVGFATWEQSLLVGAGNPLGIRGVGDLGRAGVRLLNREPGSGSRALLDARLEESGVPAAAVAGYESATAGGHLAVAEAVSSGLADVGVGIRAAGLAFDLTCLPLAEERYDLVVPDHFLDLPAVQALIDALRSRSLRAQVELLGGYDGSGMGRPA